MDGAELPTSLINEQLISYNRNPRDSEVAGGSGAATLTKRVVVELSIGYRCRGQTPSGHRLPRCLGNTGEHSAVVVCECLSNEYESQTQYQLVIGSTGIGICMLGRYRLS